MSKKFFRMATSAAAEGLGLGLGYQGGSTLKELAIGVPKYVYEATWGPFAEGLGIREPQELGASSVKDKPEDVVEEPPKNTRNKITTSPYEYSELPPGDQRKCARFLEILPGTAQDDINCQLHQHYLDNAPPYETLSYCWGTTANRTPVQIDGSTLYITKNLRRALFHLRHETQSRLMWVDAICINQNDLPERAEQITIMRDLYRSSTQTVIWIHQGNEELAGALDKCIELAELARADQSVLIGSGPGKDETSKARSDSEFADKMYGLTEDPIDALLLTPWFSRVWVVQELVLSKRRTLLLGNEQLDWDTFCIALEYGVSQDIWKRQELGYIRQPLFDQFYSLRGIDTSIHSTVFEGKDPAGKLLDILIKLRVRAATDPRDKVFGILGIIPAVDDIGIVANYESDVAEVYKKTAQQIIHSSGSLDVLGVANTNQHENAIALPLWCPDWSIEKIIAAPFCTLKPRDGEYDATSGSRASVIFVDDELIIEGYLFDTIAEVADVLPDMNDDPWGAISTPVSSTATSMKDDSENENDEEEEEDNQDSGQDEPEASERGEEETDATESDVAERDEADADVVDSDGEEKQAKASEAKASESAENQEYEGNQTSSDKEPTELAPEERKESTIAEDFDTMYTNLVAITAHLAVFVHWERFAQPEPAKDIAKTVYLNDYIRTITAGMLNEPTDEFTEWRRSLDPVRRLMRWGMDSWPRMFKLMGFVGYVRRTWHKLPAFSAKLEHLPLRRLARTQQGNLCLVPAATQIGDGVWLCRGGKVPLVLRKESEGTSRLVGEAYVNGIMGGEAWDEGRLGQLNLI
ncbi:HET-domain-containing protein [Microthyrium microscopicum]|uniref:HET-domain-containing protein n=1 Tax=Microthyrium microscopicum TaxID=703497 RepID=A0A6A6TZE2_9PEZI|nr:HET-domain-containing protein [Microthyrium microscopicum]